MSKIVKLKTATGNQMPNKPPRPTKAAIEALKRDPSLSGAFDQKFGAGTASAHLYGTAELTGLMRDMIEGQAELAELIAELIETVKAPRQAIMDQDGNVVGAVPMTTHRLDETTNEWVCNQCEKPQGACTCDHGGDGDLLKA